MAVPRFHVALIATVAAVALAGCGGEEEETTAAGDTTEAAQADATIEIVETDFELDPADATVDEEGTTAIEVVNEGETAHSLEVEASDEEFVSDTIEPGESTSLVAELDSGEYEMYCPIANHADLGMEGTLTVGSGGGGGSGGEDDSAGSAPY